jgi:hypothetical protein
MRKKGDQSASSFKSLLKAYAMLLFLGLYLLGTSRIESFHGLFVQHNPPELHASEQEADPCHRNIYHQESSSKCEHRTHIVDNHKCPVCDSQCHSAQILENSLINFPDFFTVTSLACTRSSAVQGFYSYSSSRAPPVI